MEKISRNIAAFFAALFVLMGLELVTETSTYVYAPSVSEAEAVLSPWTAADMSAQASYRHRQLVEFMTSGYRFYVHRVLLTVLFACYMFCAWGIWRRRTDMTRFIVFTFLVKLGHSAFFLWHAYVGRMNVAAFFGQEKAPFFTGAEAEVHYLLGGILAAICILYFGRFPVHSLPRRYNQWRRSAMALPK